MVTVALPLAFHYPGLLDAPVGVWWFDPELGKVDREYQPGCEQWVELLARLLAEITSREAWDEVTATLAARPNSQTVDKVRTGITSVARPSDLLFGIRSHWPLTH